MENRGHERRNKMVVVRLNKKEYDHLRKHQQQTTERTISAYLRKLVLQKPVTTYYRNASADAFLDHMLQLKKELYTLNTAFSQAVQQLQLLDQIPEFRSWINRYETTRSDLVTMTGAIHQRVTQLYEQWLQK